MNAEIMMASEQIDSPSVEDGCGGSSSGDGSALKKGPWTSIEDAILIDYVRKHGEGNWNSVQKHSGLSRCGKSCRLRWANHLRPNLKKGAFSTEEEKLIIELHAKLGNKWARMATHLPGRTDNEIKNYWNTRIKRRQRAGLPLYPPPLCFQASNYSQNNHIENEFSCYYKEKNEKTIGIPSIMLDNIKGNRGNVPYAPPFPENSFRSMMGQSCGSQPSGFMNQVTNHLKQLQEPQPLLPSFPGSFANGFSRLDQLSEFSRNACRTLGMVYPPDSDPNRRNLSPFEGSTSGSHALLNGKFSASKPIIGDLMLELPSFQCPETDSSGWLSYPSAPLQPIRTHVQPPPATVPDCASSHNSGLLEDLLHEAKTFCNSNNQPSARSSNCSTPLPSSIAESSLPGSCETGWEEFNDPISPLGCSAASIFSESTTPISGFLFNEYLCSKVASGAGGLIQVTADDCPTPNIGKNEAQPGFMRPDSLVETDCPEGITEAAKNQTILNNVLATLLSDDFHGESQPIGTSSMLDNSGELDSCPWNNMPNFQLSNFS